MCKNFETYSEDSVNYPKYALDVAESVKSGECENGILCCDTGVGISIDANKVPRIRAVAVGDCFTAQATKEHNNSYIICLGERVIGEGLALMIVDAWINAEFIGGKHQTLLDLINEIEEKYIK